MIALLTAVQGRGPAAGSVDEDSYTAAVPPVRIAVPIGLVAGFASGLFGIGGGVIVVPALVLLLGFSQHQASGTSTATIVASSAAALVVFSGESEVDWQAAVLLLTGSGLGAWFGAKNLSRIPERWLSAAFSVVMVIAAVRMLLP